MYNIYPVFGEEVVAVWPQIEGWVEKALFYGGGRYSVASFIVDLMQGDESLWIVRDEGLKLKGFFTLRVLQYPHKKMCCLRVLGGEDFDAWMPDGLDVLLSFVENEGCNGIEINGREGWWKYLKKLGFSRSSTYELML